MSEDSGKMWQSLAILVVIIAAAAYFFLLSTKISVSRPTPATAPTAKVKPATAPTAKVKPAAPMPVSLIKTMGVSVTGTSFHSDIHGKSDYCVRIKTKTGKMGLIIQHADFKTGKWEYNYDEKKQALVLMRDDNVLYTVPTGKIVVADSESPDAPETYEYSKVVKTKGFDLQKTLEEIKKIRESSDIDKE